MTADGRGPRISFGGSPWGRNALLVDKDRAVDLAHRAQALRANVSIVGKAERGPWIVSVWNSKRGLRFAGYRLHDVIEFGLERWEADATDKGIRWTTGPDKLTHGYAGRSPFTLCKQPGRDERTGGYPEHARCEACWRALDRKLAAA